MGRKFVVTSEADLRAKIDVELEDQDGFKDYFGDDLKVEFDFENFESDDEYKTWPELSKLIGYQSIQTSKGLLVFRGQIAGGDWEQPVFFIIYDDGGKKLRAYVPSNGNPWNKTKKRAYNGFACNLYEDEKAEGEEKSYEDEDTDIQEDLVDLRKNKLVDFDQELIIKDIINRFG